MTGINNSIFKPLQATLWLEQEPFAFVPLVVAVSRISLQAGAEIGTAVVQYPATYAMNATAGIGKRASISIGDTMVFRGCVAHAPFEISQERDEFELILSCDKWLMQVATIGQALFGSQTGGGFLDVGSEVVFNKDGKPNKDANALDFHLGSGAVYWSLQNMLAFLFQYYISTTVAVIPGSLTLPQEFLLTPSHVNIMGQSALQAVDTICKIAGVSWGLVPATAASELCIVKPGTGTQQVARMFMPKNGAGVSGVNTLHATAARVEHSMINAYDHAQAISGNMVVDHTYSSTGTSPLLVRQANFVDKKFAARFGVDVTKYADHNLGQNLSSGAKPKPWLSSLVTRIAADGASYLTAAQIDADPLLRDAKHVDAPIVWLAEDADIDNARLVTGGMRVDHQACVIDFEPTIQFAKSAAVGSANADQTRKIADWSTVGIWVSVATMLERVEYHQDEAVNPWLALAHYRVIRKDDLVPEKRYYLYLPDLTDASNRNAIDLQADSAVEAYVDVADQLSEIAAAALTGCNALETRLELRFPCFPLFQIGDWVTIAGRTLGLSGNEVVIGIDYDVNESFETTIQCTNVIAGVKPGKYLEADL